MNNRELDPSEIQERVTIDLDTDLGGSEPMRLLWGDDRFNGWYLTKTPVRTETAPLGVKDLTYLFTIADFNYRFFIPGRISFSGGTIIYSEAERRFGLFRFPRDGSGRFSIPVSDKGNKELVHMSEKELKESLRGKQVLTFEAFRVPQHGFQYFVLTESDLTEIRKTAGEEFTRNFKSQYDLSLGQKIQEVKNLILSRPNYLLILQNILDFQLKNMQEVSHMTGGILHI